MNGASVAYIALGSNIGDPSLNVERAITQLQQLGEVTARSSLYVTAPWGYTDQPDFVNAVVRLATRLPARDLLGKLKEMEQQLGRVETVRWGPRLIDLDILIYDDISIDEPGLTVPHPRMLERAFVLVPLAEIEPQYATARDALPATSLEEVRPIDQVLRRNNTD